MLPLIPIGIGMMIGVPIGWKVGRWLFGEEVEADISDIEEKYNSLRKILELSQSESFKNQKVYGYYLFGLIKSQQQLLLFCLNNINNSDYINYFKNTFVEWDKVIETIKNEVSVTYDRFLIYESLFKELFNIPYSETDILKIALEIKPYASLSETELKKLAAWIINPLFNGWYDVEFTNIKVMRCWFIKLGEIEKYPCKADVVKYFVPPLTKKINNHNEGACDIIIPWVLYNTVLKHETVAKEMQDKATGALDKAVSLMTGVDAGYAAKTKKAAEDLKNSSADFYLQMKKEFRDLQNSLSNTYQGTSDGFSSFTTALTYGGLALGGYLVYDLFTSNK